VSCVPSQALQEVSVTLWVYLEEKSMQFARAGTILLHGRVQVTSQVFEDASQSQKYELMDG
jgi:hypothetical protein